MAELGNIEIHVSVDDDHLKVDAPGIQASGSSAAREKPRLPFLNQVHSLRPTSPQSLDTPSGEGTHGTKGLPFLRELITSKIRRRNTRTRQPTTEFANSPMTPKETGETGIKSGKLLKTSRSRTTEEEPGTTKQRRFWLRKEQRLFRLTEDALEYYQQFNQVKLRRNYPLTSIEQIVYNDGSEPLIFHLLFQKYEMILEAETEEDARSWVECIRDAWSKWNTEIEVSFNDDENFRKPFPVLNDQDSIIEPITSPPPDGAKVLPSPDGLPPPPTFTSPRSTSRPGSFTRPRAHSAMPMLRRESREDDMGTLGRSKRKNAFRLARLTPRLEMAPRTEPTFPVRPERRLLTKNQTIVSDPESKVAVNRLHYNFAMVKYPRTPLGIPHERVFKVDKDNLLVLWRRNAASGLRMKSSLQLHKIVEVREGQLTDSFEKFPYEEVKDQSLSLIFEEETKKYVRLTSIDVICDHPDNYDQWIEGLASLVSGTKCSIYPDRYETTDPLVLWLKQIWTCKSDNHEICLRDAIKFVRKLQPQIPDNEAKSLIKVAHSHQFRLTHNQTNLRWDGFTMLFNLVCVCTAPSARLKEVFGKYATKYPDMGLTVEELREFLVEECFWDEAQATESVLQSLISHHDYHHRAYKKMVARNRPLQYQICTKLLTYAGFLSFLRSKDNPVIDLEHETVYQDMTEPLSHYFINSSHNTYLEAGQLKGKSSLDAYIRALLQGCRCVEIDCWDDTFNVTGLYSKEPVIYHGYTLTTKLPFREVVHTIRDYSFRTSLYPVIISIENHCSSEQQSKMAKIFRAIMGDILPSENLVETEGRERLPSPQELQGKIILKGTFKKENKTGTTPRAPKMGKNTSQASLASVQSPARSTGHVVSGASLVSTSSQESEQPNSPLTPNPGDSVGQPDATPTEEQRPRVFTFTRSRSNRESLREVRNIVTEKEKGQDDQELVFEETSEDLKKLIVYCRSVSIKPWSWRKQTETTVSEMFSFGEPTAIKHCDRSQREMLQCTERQLVRTYPKGTRFESSNYDPIQMWNCGVQLVALNFQKPDIHMHLNQGFFRRNGGCGYVLKPTVMRKMDPGGARGGSAPYSPFMEVSHPDVPTIDFEIELLSGQNLCPWKRKVTSFTVDIHTYGIQHDMGKMLPSATHTDPLWPQWTERLHTLSKTIIMPELCLVYFRVEGDRNKLLGQNCISLVSLQPGYKFIPMRTSGGELIPHAGLFVKIKKKEQQFHHPTRTLNKNTSLTGKDTLNTLESISEDPEASLNPIAFKRPLHRQKQIVTEDVGDEDSFARRTMTSPPSLSTSIGVESRKTPSPDNKVQVDVEITAESSLGVEILSAASPETSRTRSITIQPSYPTPLDSEMKQEEKAEGTQSDNLKEFTLTVQAGSFSFDEGH